MFGVKQNATLKYFHIAHDEGKFKQDPPKFITKVTIGNSASLIEMDVNET